MSFYVSEELYEILPLFSGKYMSISRYMRYTCRLNVSIGQEIKFSLGPKVQPSSQ
jgi:hypothetical protein